MKNVNMADAVPPDNLKKPLKKQEAPCSPAEEMLKTIEEIYHLKDLDTLLDRILTEARRFTDADAGTIYLATKTHLHFSFTQNDTLFRDQHAKEKYVYSKATLPLDEKSIAGYVAVTGRPLLIDDVYRLGKDVPYAFNPEFDRKSSYRTQSMLTVPISARNNTLLGVLQLINARDEEGRTAAFSADDTLYITQFANNAAYAIENAKLSREMAFRMVEIAALRDPSETSAHAERVSAISAELYLVWSRKHDVDPRERRHTRESLRIAAILHDVGKVAVSDTVLKKPGELTDYERYQAQCHTVYGARLFVNTNSPWDKAASEVALNHHEQWNGGGYPGRIRDLFSREIIFGPGKKGAEIPLLARIVTLADVYDSLVSRRTYKDPWSEDEAYRYLRDNSAVIFDPELTGLFIGMSDTVRAIESRYRKAAGPGSE
jgi:response regulator RpfG family c-di-GMP phosphodiesterase